ncbi:MAG: hypothetical protein WAK20_09410 [Candidatus Acidiferrum sp.]
MAVGTGADLPKSTSRSRQVIVQQELTTTLNFLGEFIRPDEPILFIEDTSEIHMDQENLTRFEAREQIPSHHHLHHKRINLSTVFAGQAVGIEEVEEGIWLVSFMDYDLGYIDLEEKTLQPLENPFGPKV